MAGPAPEPGRDPSDRDTQSIKRRLTELEGRLKIARGAGPEGRPEPEGRGAAMGQALRLATELIAAVAVGGFIGWWLDRLFGSAPFLMVLFLLLGGAAGIMNVVRTARAMQQEAAKKQAEAGETQAIEDDEDD